MDFDKLKSISGKKSAEMLTAKLNKVGNKENTNKNDDRFWKPTVDKAGNGYAVIRFLPPPPNEDLPFVELWDHGFQGPGGWYIENSLTTLKQPDPVSEYNSALWNSGVEANKEIARKQKRRLHFFSNIYVISDPAAPQNEGKVFLFKYGKKIYDKLKEASDPQFEDEQPIDPFHFWEGANFKLKIRNVEGYRNYDKSEFEKPSALFDDDEKLKEIYKQEYSLQQFHDPSNFKSYDELKARFFKAINESSVGSSAKLRVQKEDLESWDKEEEMPKAKVAAAPKLPTVEDDDDDESLEFFKKMAAS